MKKKLTSIELCAGAGGQALGLEQAGFNHIALLENDPHACETLRINRPKWNIIEDCIRNFNAKEFYGVDLVAGGVPCQPFSLGGKQLGHKDDRDLFPEAIRIISECKPKFIFLENVRGLSQSRFDDYRNSLQIKLYELGYFCQWKVINSSNYGVPQTRLRFILVGRRDGYAPFPWGEPDITPPTVADTINDLMAKRGWKGLSNWLKKANNIAPCIVGGSKKHGGPDLGPQRARKAWAEMGVNGMGIANEPPDRDFQGDPKLTNRMAARLQGFPDEWMFAGGKTAVYRQIGNAFPPPVAQALGLALIKWSKLPAESSYELNIAQQLGLAMTS